MLSSRYLNVKLTVEMAVPAEMANGFVEVLAAHSIHRLGDSVFIHRGGAGCAGGPTGATIKELPNSLSDATPSRMKPGKRLHLVAFVGVINHRSLSLHTRRIEESPEA